MSQEQERPSLLEEKINQSYIGIGFCLKHTKNLYSLNSKSLTIVAL